MNVNEIDEIDAAIQDATKLYRSLEQAPIPELSSIDLPTFVEKEVLPPAKDKEESEWLESLIKKTMEAKNYMNYPILSELCYSLDVILSNVFAFEIYIDKLTSFSPSGEFVPYYQLTYSIPGLEELSIESKPNLLIHKLFDGDAIFNFQKIYPFSFDNEILNEWIEKDIIITIYKIQKRKQAINSGKSKNNNYNRKLPLLFYGQTIVSLRSMLFASDLTMRLSIPITRTEIPSKKSSSDSTPQEITVGVLIGYITLHVRKQSLVKPPQSQSDFNNNNSSNEQQQQQQNTVITAKDFIPPEDISEIPFINNNKICNNNNNNNQLSNSFINDSFASFIENPSIPIRMSDIYISITINGIILSFIPKKSINITFRGKSIKPYYKEIKTFKPIRLITDLSKYYISIKCNYEKSNLNNKNTFFIEICIDNEILNAIKIPINNNMYFESSIDVNDLEDNEIGKLEGIFCCGSEREVKNKLKKYKAGLTILRFFQIHKKEKR